MATVKAFALATVFALLTACSNWTVRTNALAFVVADTALVGCAAECSSSYAHGADAALIVQAVGAFVFLLLVGDALANPPPIFSGGQ